MRAQGFTAVSFSLGGISAGLANAGVLIVGIWLGQGYLWGGDITAGEVLAFVSKPTFDPNLFVEGIDSESWAALNESIDRPLLNRALRANQAAYVIDLSDDAAPPRPAARPPALRRQPAPGRFRRRDPAPRRGARTALSAAAALQGLSRRRTHRRPAAAAPAGLLGRA